MEQQTNMIGFNILDRMYIGVSWRMLGTLHRIGVVVATQNNFMAVALQVAIKPELKILLYHLIISQIISALSQMPIENETGGDNDNDDGCGEDTRIEAFVKAVGWASSEGDDWLDWDPMPWNQYEGRFGPNCAFVRQMGEMYYGYDDPDSKARIFNHPDGHPEQTGPGYPDHHPCPHYHAVNHTGQEKYFTYRRRT